MAGGYRIPATGPLGEVVKVLEDHRDRIEELERPTGSQTGIGGGGGGTDSEVRHDTAGGFSYMGSAAAGTLESASGWSVTRIELVSPPVIESGSGAWDDRAVLVYS